MNVEFTLAQLFKLSRLSPESWKTFLIFVKEGGSGDFSPDMHGLKEAGLISKTGPVAYAKFMIDGALPEKLPQAAKKNKSNEFGAFFAVWRETSKEYMTGADMAALKRFVNNYSLDEFKELIHQYRTKIPTAAPTLHGMWATRSKLSSKTLEQAFGGDNGVSVEDAFSGRHLKQKSLKEAFGGSDDET